MNIEIIKSLKERAKEMLEDNYDRIIGDEEIYTIICELEKQSKEIEELKQEKEYLNCIIESDKDNYINKDKIKAEIEELQEDIKYSANPLSIDNSKFGIKVLQSLLEKKLPTTITKEELEKRWKGVDI